MSSTNINPYKKELLFRRSQGKMKTPDYLHKIALLFSFESALNTLTLEETDAIISRFLKISAQLH